MKSKWDESRYNDSDPRNNMVEPRRVIDNYKKLDRIDQVKTSTI